MLDVIIVQTPEAIFSRRIVIFANIIINCDDAFILSPRKFNADMIFFDTDLIIDSTVDFILSVISFVISSAAVFESAFTSSLIATEQINVAPIINVTITIEAAADE